MSRQFLSTRVTRQYGALHPVVAAGMAFVGSTPELAIAVCEAGGIGSIAAGAMPPEALRGVIRAVTAATTGPFHVNFITFLATDAHFDACIEERVPIVSFHWGDPRAEVVARLHAAGVRVWEQVGSAEEARRAAANGVDLVVAQGTEAGGHNRGTLPTFVLVPEVVEAAEGIPVLAAGGVTDGRQLAAALALGAEGVWVGTRLVAAREAFAHEEYQRRLLAARGEETRLSSVYGPDMPHFNPMRVLDTGLAKECADRDVSRDPKAEPVVARMHLGTETVELRRFSSFVPTPATEGRIEVLPFLAGQGVGRVREILPAGEIVAGMARDARAILSALA